MQFVVTVVEIQRRKEERSMHLEGVIRCPKPKALGQVSSKSFAENWLECWTKSLCDRGRPLDISIDKNR